MALRHESGLRNRNLPCDRIKSPAAVIVFAVGDSFHLAEEQ